MKIVKNAENLSLKVSYEELLTIWSSLLINIAECEKFDSMDMTKDMAKTINDYIRAPF